MSPRDVCRSIVHDTANGAWNMAVDEALLHSAGQGAGPCLRLYQWSPATLSLGYFQRFGDRVTHVASRDAPIVRRSTGGGAIVHDVELTYSLTLPDRHRLATDPASLYRLVHGALIAALAGLGVRAELYAPVGSPKEPDEPFLCFQRRSVGDVVLGRSKIAGSAQRRHRGAILQHGSVLLGRSKFAPELAGINDLGSSPPTADSLIEAWLPALADALDVSWFRGDLSGAEEASARDLVGLKHATKGWVEKR